MRVKKIRKRKGRTLIIGLGDVMLQDDGVGVHALRELKKSPPQDVLTAEMGTSVLGNLDLIEWADHILAIDSMQAGGVPGTIYAYEVEDVEDRGLYSSRNEMCLFSALRLLPKRIGPQVIVLGVEPERIQGGFGLSSTLEQALPRIVRSAREIIDHVKGSYCVETDWERLDCCPRLAAIFTPEVRLL